MSWAVKQYTYSVYKYTDYIAEACNILSSVLREIFNNILTCIFEASSVCMWGVSNLTYICYFIFHSFLTCWPKMLLSKTSIFVSEKRERRRYWGKAPGPLAKAISQLSGQQWAINWGPHCFWIIGKTRQLTISNLRPHLALTYTVCGFFRSSVPDPRYPISMQPSNPLSFWAIFK